MDKTNFFDNYFKVLTLLFWPIIWFKWRFISTSSLSYLMFIIYLALSIVYLILFSYFCLKNKNTDSIVFLYRLSTLLTFVFTLLSFLLFPKNLFLLYLEMVFIAFYFYSSCLKVYRHHMDEGVVGILSSFLLIAITIFSS